MRPYDMRDELSITSPRRVCGSGIRWEPKRYNGEIIEIRRFKKSVCPIRYAESSKTHSLHRCEIVHARSNSLIVTSLRSAWAHLETITVASRDSRKDSFVLSWVCIARARAIWPLHSVVPDAWYFDLARRTRRTRRTHIFIWPDMRDETVSAPNGGAYLIRNLILAKDHERNIDASALIAAVLLLRRCKSETACRACHVNPITGIWKSCKNIFASFLSPPTDHSLSSICCNAFLRKNNIGHAGHIDVQHSRRIFSIFSYIPFWHFRKTSYVLSELKFSFYISAASSVKLEG